MREIIIVDDDIQFQYIMGSILHTIDSKKKFSSYLNSTQALHDFMKCYFLSENLPEIIFLDINMPMVSGWNFLDAINNLGGLKDKVPAVYLVTSSIDPMDRKRSGLYSIVKGYISKPITPQILMQVLEGN